MTIRVECTSPGLEACWIEVAEVWTRHELREYNSQQGEPFIALWRKKVTACHLVTVEGEPIDDPRQVHERLDDLDLRLLGFISGAPQEVTSHLLMLGEVNKRLSSNGAGVVARTTMAPGPKMS